MEEKRKRQSGAQTAGTSQERELETLRRLRLEETRKRERKWEKVREGERTIAEETEPYLVDVAYSSVLGEIAWLPVPVTLSTTEAVQNTGRNMEICISPGRGKRPSHLGRSCPSFTPAISAIPHFVSLCVCVSPTKEITGISSR
ncbi:unnamed protein product [[Candida] boidinii]|nr:unnamed protein product [[Candida] boidinii]